MNAYKEILLNARFSNSVRTHLAEVVMLNSIRCSKIDN
jgi:hypothetical protein